MIRFLNSIFAFLAVMLRFFEKRQENKQRRSEIIQSKKALAYEKFQKSIKARLAARKSVSDDNILSDDGYKRE